MTIQTQPTATKAIDVINTVEHDIRREDGKQLLALFKNITEHQPVVWGDNKIGFGKYHYKYASGQEGDWFLIGFTIGKTKISIHIINGFDSYGKLLEKLGKHKTSRGCLYITKLKDVDLDILRKIITDSYKTMKETHKQ
jgi:hypothetical protein